MGVIHTIAELRARLANENSIAFVPTMGNLHEGHLDLVRIAREQGRCVVVSIFVNPLQFGPSEDFERYPRTLEADCAKLAGLADVVFAPAAGDMYPVRQRVFVELPPIAGELCGASRPGHFRGMATVVLKLLNIVRPQVAVFGKKDYQQLHIVRRMVAELDLPIRIVGGETVRAQDGLALSSRNQYLSESERAEAPFLYRALLAMRQAVLQRVGDIEQIRRQTVSALETRGWAVDYIELRNQSDLQAADLSQPGWVILAAAKLGNTRLLDNVEIGLAG
ncbi:MAG: pantoate--beta-alanine ligase [Gallionella sp.]|nr:pantoate--beta-alanine ligase [Gallionella sp.]